MSELVNAQTKNVPKSFLDLLIFLD